MSLTSPNLDDRDFNQLMQAALDRIRQRSPEWTDLSVHDPGVVLAEVFAYLTETLLYRVNRIPEKVYVELLRLIGVRVEAPTAATALLEMKLDAPARAPVTIPEGSVVSAAGAGEPLEFVTAASATIPAGQQSVNVKAHHAHYVDGELAGKGTGRPGQWVRTKFAPLVARTDPELEILVGVEATPEELSGRARAREYKGKSYRLWREVDNFADLPPDDKVFIADRVSGVISFAPAARLLDVRRALAVEPTNLAAVPPPGREIRLWYRWGGGPAGNVGAGAITQLKAPVSPKPKVSNPAPASGGRSAETVENALIRGPQELRSLNRAVTAKDFEILALRVSREIARTRAFTGAELWKHARPGSVDVLLVPALPEGPVGEVMVERLQAAQSAEKLKKVQDELNLRKPIGTLCAVKWARYKTVSVRARVVAHRGEQLEALRGRVLERLHASINPISGENTGSVWGRPLRASNVYDMILAEPGVSFVDQIKLVVDEVPRSAQVVVRDPAQPATWYVASGLALFRSTNDGQSWECMLELEGKEPTDEIRAVRRHPDVPGLLAVAYDYGPGADGQGRSRLRWSFDAGESWNDKAEELPRVNGLAWRSSEGASVLMVATDLGLWQLSMRPGSSPLTVGVDPKNVDLGFFAVAVAPGIPGSPEKVAVAARGLGGVYLSVEGKAFKNIGPDHADVRVLEVQWDGPRSFLWAGLAASGDQGKGCQSWELTGSGNPPEGWQEWSRGWKGGSCFGLAFLRGPADKAGPTVAAATYSAGVVRLDARRRDSEWDVPALGCGLPEKSREQPYVRLRGVASDGDLLLAGADEGGVYRSTDGGASYRHASGDTFTETLLLPKTWLLCSREHEIDVVPEDEVE